MQTNLEFIHITQDDLCYGFDDQGPHFKVNGGDYSRTVRVDPFPGYAHEEPVARATANHVAAAFPMDLKVQFYLSEFEPLERTNAWASTANYYNKPVPEGRKSSVWDGVIVCAGKRIPPHPAMTRYLIAHEYGHIVESWLNWISGEDAGSKSVLGEYAKLRGVPPITKTYGSRTWHASIGEMFANDFRILVCGVEPEFWPHAGFSRPEQLPQIVEWWKEKTNANNAPAQCSANSMDAGR